MNYVDPSVVITQQVFLKQNYIYTDMDEKNKRAHTIRVNNSQQFGFNWI